MHITQDMIRWASFGMSTTWLSDKTGMTVPMIQKAFRDGLLKRPFGTKLKLYCDYDFFETIDTEAKAYWLGFIYADGCVTDDNHINILLAGYEKDHLAKYKTALNAEHPIEERRDIIRQGGVEVRRQHNVKVRLTSPLMCRHLARLGVRPRKSLTLTFPTSDQVPPHLLHHFIRGYFDGDGCICHSQVERYAGRWLFSVISTEVFVRSLLDTLKHHVKIDAYSVRSHSTSKGMSYLEIGNVPDINRIRDYLYQDATIYLDRKRAKFDEMPIRYHRSVYDRMKDTLVSMLSQANLSIFSSRDLMRLYGVGKDTVFVPLSRLEADGLIVRAGNRGKTILYRLSIS